MCRLTEPAGPDRSMSALETTTTGHVEFINDCGSTDIGDLDMKCQEGPTDAQTTEKETTERAPAIHLLKVAYNQPSGARRFRVFQNSRWRCFSSCSFKSLLNATGVIVYELAFHRRSRPRRL